MSKKTKILLLEDEEIHRLLLGDGLEDYYDCEIERAEDIEGAEEILKSFRPDMFLLDIVLKGDKFRVIPWVKQLRAQGYGNIPVLFVTAQPEMREHVKGMECTDFLGKPFTFEDVVGKIRRLLSLPKK
jgi:two-component system OmpR family response regulator